MKSSLLITLALTAATTNAAVIGTCNAATSTIYVFATLRATSPLSNTLPSTTLSVNTPSSILSSNAVASISSSVAAPIISSVAASVVSAVVLSSQGCIATLTSSVTCSTGLINALNIVPARCTTSFFSAYPQTCLTGSSRSLVPTSVATIPGQSSHTAATNAAMTTTLATSSVSIRPTSVVQQTPSTTTSVLLPVSVNDTLPPLTFTPSSNLIVSTPVSSLTTIASSVGTTLVTRSSTISSLLTPTTLVTSQGAVVTDRAYIDTVLRHHNVHRSNHSAPALTWSSSLADTAKKIAQSCAYAHDTQTDCSAGGGCYGQNIAAGYASTEMGALISDGFYNSEVNSYVYYGTEPSTATVENGIHAWGHFTQIVWIGSASVGCYTQDCSANANPLLGSSGLGNVAPSTNVRPIFTVCNYSPPGNYINLFTPNVLPSRNLPSVHAAYGCPSTANCADTNVVPGSLIA